MSGRPAEVLLPNTGENSTLPSRFFRTDPAEAVATGIYGAAVAQARRPELYAVLGVPDSVTGRFEMVVLHAVLVIERLKRDGEAGRALGQLVFDDFCRDMDQSLRELGFGDQAVPKRMKALGEGFYGRAAAYGDSLGDRPGLATAIARNVFPDGEPPVAAGWLADYAIAVAAALAGTSVDEIAAGRAVLPDPAAFAKAEA